MKTKKAVLHEKIQWEVDIPKGIKLLSDQVWSVSDFSNDCGKTRVMISIACNMRALDSCWVKNKSAYRILDTQKNRDWRKKR